MFPGRLLGPPSRAVWPGVFARVRGWTVCSSCFRLLLLFFARRPVLFCCALGGPARRTSCPSIPLEGALLRLLALSRGGLCLFVLARSLAGLLARTEDVVAVSPRPLARLVGFLVLWNVFVLVLVTVLVLALIASLLVRLLTLVAVMLEAIPQPPVNALGLPLIRKEDVPREVVAFAGLLPFLQR